MSYGQERVNHGVHSVAVEMVVAALEVWLATKVSAAVTTLSAAAAVARTVTTD